MHRMAVFIQYSIIIAYYYVVTKIIQGILNIYVTIYMYIGFTKFRFVYTV